MEKNIAVIYGDCASPEIVTQALRVLDAVAEKFGHTFTYTKVLMGGEAIDALRGSPAPVGTGQVPAKRQRAAGGHRRPQVGGPAR